MDYLGVSTMAITTSLHLKDVSDLPKKFNEKIDYDSIDLSDNFVIRKKFPTANTIIYQNLDLELYFY